MADDIPVIPEISMRLTKRSLAHLENVKSFMRDETEREPSDQAAIELALALASSDLDVMAGLKEASKP